LFGLTLRLYEGDRLRVLDLWAPRLYGLRLLRRGLLLLDRPLENMSIIRRLSKYMVCANAPKEG
jgi:hypothetical protein